MLIQIAGAEVITGDPACNVTDNIHQKMGFKLHQNPNHPLCIIKTAIYDYFDTRFGAPPAPPPPVTPSCRRLPTAGAADHWCRPAQRPPVWLIAPPRRFLPASCVVPTAAPHDRSARPRAGPVTPLQAILVQVRTASTSWTTFTPWLALSRTSTRLSPTLPPRRPDSPSSMNSGCCAGLPAAAAAAGRGSRVRSALW